MDYSDLECRPESVCGPPGPPAELSLSFDPNVTFYDHETEGFYPTYNSTMCGTDPNRITYIEPYLYSSSSYDTDREEEDDEAMRIRMWNNMNFSTPRTPEPNYQPEPDYQPVNTSRGSGVYGGYSSSFSPPGGAGSSFFSAASPPPSPIKSYRRSPGPGDFSSSFSSPGGAGSSFFNAASPPPSPIKSKGGRISAGGLLSSFSPAGGGSSFFSASSPPPSPIKSHQGSGRSNVRSRGRIPTYQDSSYPQMTVRQAGRPRHHSMQGTPTRYNDPSYPAAMRSPNRQCR